jgi:hypothetical protein
MTRSALLAAGLLSGIVKLAGAARFVPLEPRRPACNRQRQPHATTGACVEPGRTRLLLEVVVDIDNGPGGDSFTFTMGDFSSSSALLGNEEHYRVTGAIATDAPAFVSSRTCVAGHLTDIAKDFGFDFCPIDLPGSTACIASMVCVSGRGHGHAAGRRQPQGSCSEARPMGPDRPSALC